MGLSSLLGTYLVTPGVAPTLHARARFRLLIKLLFPTFGKPAVERGQTRHFAWQQRDHRVNGRLTHNTHSDGGLYVLVATVVPEMFHQAVCADTSAAAEKLCGRLCHRHVAAFLFITKRYKCEIFCRGFGFESFLNKYIITGHTRFFVCCWVDALKATVGNSFRRYLIHFSTMSFDTKSVTRLKMTPFRIFTGNNS